MLTSLLLSCLDLFFQTISNIFYVFGTFCWLYGPIGVSWGSLWEIVREFLGGSWAVLGVFLGFLGRSWGVLGVFLGGSCGGGGWGTVRWAEEEDQEEEDERGEGGFRRPLSQKRE